MNGAATEAQGRNRLPARASSARFEATRGYLADWLETEHAPERAGALIEAACGARRRRRRIASPVVAIGGGRPAATAARPVRDAKSDPVAARARLDPPPSDVQTAAPARAPRPAYKSDGIESRGVAPEVDVHEESSPVAEPAEDDWAAAEDGGEATQDSTDRASTPFELARPKSVRPAASLSPITKEPAPAAAEMAVTQPQPQPQPGGARRWWFAGAAALLVAAGTWAATRSGDRAPSALPAPPASTPATPQAAPPAQANGTDSGAAERAALRGRAAA